MPTPERGATIGGRMLGVKIDSHYRRKDEAVVRRERGRQRNRRYPQIHTGFIGLRCAEQPALHAAVSIGNKQPLQPLA